MEEYKFEEIATQPLKAGRLVWQDDTNHIQEYVLYEGISTTIGRERGNHILLSNPIVSKNHAIIQWKKGAFVITDRGSSNGTFVNRRLIHEPTPLSDSDSIEIGDYRIKFYAMEDQQIEFPGPESESGEELDYGKLASEITTQRTVPRSYPGREAEKKIPPDTAEKKPIQEPPRPSAPPNPVWLAADELDEAALELSTEEFLAGVGFEDSEATPPSTGDAGKQPPFLSEEDFESLIKAVEAKQAALDEEIPEPEPPQAVQETAAEVEEWMQETSPSEEEEAPSVGEETLVVEAEVSEEEILSWALDEEENELPESLQPAPQPAPPMVKQELPGTTLLSRPSDQGKIEGAYAGLMDSLQSAQENGQILRDKGLALQQKVSASIEQLQAVLKEMNALEINASEVQLDDLLASLPNTPYDVRLLMNLADNSELLARILKESLALGEMIEKAKLELEEALQHYSG